MPVPHSSPVFQIDGRSFAEILEVFREPPVGPLPPQFPESEQKWPTGVKLAAHPETAHDVFGGDAVKPDTAVTRILDLHHPGLHQGVYPGDGTYLPQQAGIETDLVDPVGDVLDRAGHRIATGGIHLDDHDVATAALPHQRFEHRIAHEAAVPVVLAVDLDGLVNLGQAGGSEQHLHRERLAREDAQTVGPHVGGRNVELDAPAPPHAIEVDRVREHVPQGIDVEWVELVRRQRVREPVEPPGKWVRRPCEIGDEGAVAAHRPPEVFQRLFRSCGAAFFEPIRQHRGVHGAGARAADGLDDQALILQYSLQHTPGEGAMGASALERQGDQAGLVATFAHPYGFTHVDIISL